jgi:uncharacterized protein
MHPQDVIPVAGFDWDAANRDKCERHGVALATIEALFRQALAIVPDPTHSRAETRFKAIGRSEAGRYVMAFTLRERNGVLLIRPISARYMHQKEIRHYEEEIAKTQKR